MSRFWDRKVGTEEVATTTPGADASGAGAGSAQGAAVGNQVLQGTASTGQQVLQGAASTGQQVLQGAASTGQQVLQGAASQNGNQDEQTATDMKEVVVTAKNPAGGGPTNNGQIVDGQVTPAPAVQPLGGEELQKAAAADKYLQEHPWVAASGLNDVYKQNQDITPQQLLTDYQQYKAMQGESVTPEEYYAILRGRDPFKSEKDIKQENRRLYWKENLNKIGDVLAHFVNFGRAMGGNPIAQIQNSDNSQIERLRAAQQQLERQHYMDYVNALNDQYKTKQAKEEKEAERQHQIMMKELEWTSPKYRAELQRLAASVEKAKWDTETAKAKAEYQILINKGEKPESAAEKVTRELKKKLTESQINRNNRSGGNSANKTNNTKKKFTVVGADGEEREYQSRVKALEASYRELDLDPDAEIDDIDKWSDSKIEQQLRENQRKINERRK